MSDKKAQMMAEQLTPILKETQWYIQQIRVDLAAKDIELVNLVGATMKRISYQHKKPFAVALEIFQYLAG